MIHNYNRHFTATFCGAIVRRVPELKPTWPTVWARRRCCRRPRSACTPVVDSKRRHFPMGTKARQHVAGYRDHSRHAAASRRGASSGRVAGGRVAVGCSRGRSAVSPPRAARKAHAQNVRGELAAHGLRVSTAEEGAQRRAHARVVLLARVRARDVRRRNGRHAGVLRGVMHLRK